MDFIVITKVLSALLYPLGFAFICGMFSLFYVWRSRRLASLFAIIGVSILLVCSNPMVANFAVGSLEQKYPPVDISELGEHDVILVLGGGLRLPLPPTKRAQIGSGSDRYWLCAKLYNAGLAKKIFIAAGNVYQQERVNSEAYYAAQLLSEWRVDESAIVIENSSRNTRQNFSNTVKLLLKEEVKNVMLVTSGYHMPRALYELNQVLINELEQTDNQAGLGITPVSADTLIRNSRVPLVLEWLPSAHALALTTLALHEYYGIWFSKFRALISTF